jgi:hypothetical protein
MAKNKVIPITGNVTDWIEAITIGLQCTKAAIQDADIGIAETDGMQHSGQNPKNLAAMKSATTVLGEILNCTKVSASDSGTSFDGNGTTVCVLDEKQTNTVLAALRYLQTGTLIGQATSERTDDLLSKSEIDALCAQLVAPANETKTIETLKANGMDLGVCTRAFAVDDNDPYAIYARANLTSNEVELDDAVCIAPGDDGAFVMMWQWVSSSQAGIVSNSECLELLLDFASEKLVRETLTTTEHQTTRIYLDWLEDLISNFADELDSIAQITDLRSGPHTIDWLDEHHQTHTFAPSEALAWLHHYAYQGERNALNEQLVHAFMAAHGKTLDSVLGCVATC